MLFGSVFPPLGLEFVACSYIYACYLQVELGRLSDISNEEELLIIDNDCKGAIENFKDCVKPLLVFFPLFYAVFFFDMLGDDFGIKARFIMLLSVFCVVSMVILIKNVIHCMIKY